MGLSPKHGTHDVNTKKICDRSFIKMNFIIKSGKPKTIQLKLFKMEIFNFRRTFFIIMAA